MIRACHHSQPPPARREYRRRGPRHGQFRAVGLAHRGAARRLAQRPRLDHGGGRAAHRQGGAAIRPRCARRCRTAIWSMPPPRANAAPPRKCSPRPKRPGACAGPLRAARRPPCCSAMSVPASTMTNFAGRCGHHHSHRRNFPRSIWGRRCCCPPMNGSAPAMKPRPRGSSTPRSSASRPRRTWCICSNIWKPSFRPAVFCSRPTSGR